MGVDSMLLAEAADLIDRVGRRMREPERLDTAASELERREVVPEAEGEAAVATARAAAADVGLDEDDLGRRSVLLDPQRRPQPGEAAADDADLSAVVAAERPGLARARRPRCPPPTATSSASRKPSLFARAALTSAPAAPSPRAPGGLPVGPDRARALDPRPQLGLGELAVALLQRIP